LESSEGRFLGQCHFAKKSAPVIGNGLQWGHQGHCAREVIY
jgi:hypothetical protein